MPKLDKTGPQGQGPQTGRGMGNCPSGAGRRFGYGFGRGFGCGRGRGCGWSFYQPTAKEEKEMLNEELKYLREDIKEIEKRLGETKKTK